MPFQNDRKIIFCSHKAISNISTFQKHFITRHYLNNSFNYLLVLVQYEVEDLPMPCRNIMFVMLHKGVNNVSLILKHDNDSLRSWNSLTQFSCLIHD